MLKTVLLLGEDRMRYDIRNAINIDDKTRKWTNGKIIVSNTIDEEITLIEIVDITNPNIDIAKVRDIVEDIDYVMYCCYSDSMNNNNRLIKTCKFAIIPRSLPFYVVHSDKNKNICNVDVFCNNKCHYLTSYVTIEQLLNYAYTIKLNNEFLITPENINKTNTNVTIPITSNEETNTTVAMSITSNEEMKIIKSTDEKYSERILTELKLLLNNPDTPYVEPNVLQNKLKSVSDLTLRKAYTSTIY